MVRQGRSQARGPPGLLVPLPPYSRAMLSRPCLTTRRLRIMCSDATLPAHRTYCSTPITLTIIVGSGFTESVVRQPFALRNTRGACDGASPNAAIHDRRDESRVWNIGASVTFARSRRTGAGARAFLARSL
ncbi:unnamed protein product [Pieris macdunnoughi]|uniref:Uncharacterized protein n=1 Tax=Pieris macdunnoughi TaxID=345717 RepID=A0A821L2F5_9NEOP|nr:unnamed protein product [Pieris macdunnoughi]